MLRALQLFLIFSCLHTPALCQHHLFRSYTISQGLSNNAIRKIFQDENGFLWIATWEGLNKYDGHRFTAYSTANGLPHSMVNDIVQSKAGSISVVLNNGTISELKMGQIVQSRSTAPYIINQLYVVREGLLVGTADGVGLVQLDGNKITRLNPGDTHTLTEMIRVGQFYMAVGFPPVVSIFDEDFRVIGQTPPFPMFTNCILSDQRSRIWVGTDRGLRRLNITDLSKPQLELPAAPFNHPLLMQGKISAILQDFAGQYWFGTHDGLVKVSPDGHVQLFKEKDGLPDSKITALFEDREKNLWIGTYAGLAKLPYQNVQIFDQSASLGESSGLQYVNLLDAQHFIVCSHTQCYEFYPKDNRFTKMPLGRGGIKITPVSGKGPLMFVVGNEVYRLDPDKKFRNIDRLPEGYFFSAAQYGRMLAAAAGGVYLRWEKGHSIHLLDSNRINNVIFDQGGNLWAGAWDQGLYRIKLDTSQRTVKELRDLGPETGITHVRALYEDHRGWIWVGTRYDGVKVLIPQKEGWTSRSIQQTQGLISNWIFSITEDYEGNLWVGTLNGVDKIIVEKNGFRVFNLSRTTEFYAAVVAMIIPEKNRIWGCFDRGIFSFEDRHLERSLPGQVFLTGVRFGSGDSNYVLQPPGTPIRLNPGQNYAKFSFTSPGYINENENHFQYRLVGGGDTNWRTPSGRHEVEFASLRPGKYLFEVRTAGWNGGKGPATRYHFEIRRPFRQTAAFYAVVVFFIIGLMYALYRYRIRQLKRVQQVRNVIASDLHDDIGASLTHISILSQLSLRHLHRPEEARQFISRISEQVQDSSEALDDIIWSVNGRHDSFDEMLARMRRVAGDMFDQSSVEYELKFDNGGEPLSIDMEQRRDIFLSYKEVLNNVRKHAKATRVNVSVRRHRDSIEVIISDNGVGFDQHRPTDRNGIRNMYARTSRWKGSLEIESAQGQGTRVRLLFAV